MGVQHQDLRIRKPLPHNAVEFRRIEIRQLRIQQKHGFFLAVLPQLREGLCPSARFQHAPPRKTKLLSQFFPQFQVRTDHKDVDWISVFKTHEISSRSRHGESIACFGFRIQGARSW